VAAEVEADVTGQEAKDRVWKQHLEQEYEWLSLLSEQKVIEYRRAWEKTYLGQLLVIALLWQQLKRAILEALHLQRLVDWLSRSGRRGLG
jgi:hypothetical protein